MNPLTELLDDLEPQERERCNTWPLQRPQDDGFNPQTSPLIHEQIPEETSDQISNAGSFENINLLACVDNNSPSFIEPSISPTSSEAAVSKKISSRKNAWGNLSYADLITQAILSTPEKRLTLSQVYDWMIQNVPYFRDKGDSNSSAGWKNSIRHNLSLHSRFIRVQNEGAGKSSWWMINPDARSDKVSRRRTGSMENKNILEKKRGRVKKKLTDLQEGRGDAECDRTGDNMEETSPDFYDTHDFRTRSDSNLSNYSVGSCNSFRLSPRFEDLEELDQYLPSGDGVGNLGQPGSGGSTEAYSDLDLDSINLNDTQQLTLKDGGLIGLPVTGSNNCFMSTVPHNSVATSVVSMISPQHASPLKTRAAVLAGVGNNLTHSSSAPNGQQMNYIEMRGYIPGPNEQQTTPPIYQELNRVASNRTISMKNQAMLHEALIHKMDFAQGTGYNTKMIGNNGEVMLVTAPSSYSHAYQVSTMLPSELSEINYNPMHQADISQCNVADILRYELSVDGKLDFGNFEHFG